MRWELEGSTWYLIRSGYVSAASYSPLGRRGRVFFSEQWRDGWDVFYSNLNHVEAREDIAKICAEMEE
jgi:hypothetical protein